MKISGLSRQVNGCRISRQGAKKFCHGNVVPKGLTDVVEEVDLSGSENEGASQLKRVFAHLVLVLTMGFSALTSHGVFRLEQMQDVCRLEFDGGIRFAVSVNQKREVDAGFLSELAGVLLIAKTDGGNANMPQAKFVFVRAQLRDMLTAKNSTIMTQEGNHTRLLRP